MDSSIPVHSHNPYHGENFPLLVLDVKHKTCFPSNEGFLLPHWHEEVQFVYVLDGEVHLKVYQEEINLKKGDCVFLNCMVLHHITGKSDCHYHSYIIPPKMLSFFRKRYGSRRRNHTEQPLFYPFSAFRSQT